ncbi:MAG: hypothetical protein FJY85_21530, partial [Deltaproteobacteria bacterium]|nr:hypothetical protein [Deltaproteobacteria bacterium]
DPGRIGLLGAKALAEHKAAELNKRLDVLTKDLNQKEQTLQSITQSAKAKEEEVQRLSKRVEELQAENESRTGDLNKRMLQLTKDLNESSTAAKQFKQELKEKEELLTALKIAVTDAGRLKETAEKENERLGKALADTTQQLAASREDAEQQRRLVAQLTGQLEQTHQNAVAWHQEAQRLSNEVQQLAGQMESLKQESENLKNQISQAGSVAVTSQQEAEQYRVEGEGFRQEAVKLRVELKRAQDEVAQLKALASDLGTRLQQLQASAATAEHEGPSYVDRIIGAVTRSQRDQEGPKPAPPQAVGTTQQDTTQEDAEQPYEAPSFEDLGSGIGLPPGSQVTPPSSRPTRHKADNDKVAGQRPAPARPRPAASTLY